MLTVPIRRLKKQGDECVRGEKMGLPQAHAKAMRAAANPEPRRWLSRFFADLAYRTEKIWYSSRRLAIHKSKV